MGAEVFLPPTFALAGGVLGASLGIAYGMLHRSVVKCVLVGVLGLSLGSVVAWNVHQAGWAGDDRSGFSWYGAKGTGVILVSLGVALFMLVAAAAVVSETRRLTSRPDPVPRGDGVRKQEKGRGPK